MADIHILYSPPPEEGEIFPTVAQQEQSGYTIGSTVVQNLSEKPYLPAREAAAAEKNVLARSHNGKMSEITRDELSSTLSAIEERMDKRVERMENDTDRRAEEFRREMDLRDEAVRRELDLRREAFQTEQAIRDKAWDERFSGFLAAQTERDKRFEMLSERVVKASEGAEEAAKQAATVKSNYWAAVIVQLLAVVAILVGAYYANQANIFGSIQTTMSAFQAGKDAAKDTGQQSPSFPLPPAKQ